MRMQYKFLNFFLDKKDLLSQNNEMIDPILLENNTSQLDAIYEFYKSDKYMLYLNGFLGTGKVQLINYSKNFLSDDTIVLKHNCFETTILDDIFLTFFEEFKKLETQKIINPPRIKSENFNQKIHSYFSTIEKPILIVLNSFEALVDENRNEIVDFILHLQSFQKVKIILIGRTFKASQFPENYQIERVSTNPLEKNLFEKYLRNKKIKFNSKILDDLYKYTRGYHFFLIISLRIMENKQLSPETFLENFKKSFMNYYEFLEKESIDMVPAIAVRFYWMLCLFRHGLNITLLKQLRLYDETSINALIENNLLTRDNNQIYVPDYFKEQIDLTIPQNVANKIHQQIIDIYEGQLPLKPFERTILLSRQTMRKEIEYHSLFLPKKVNTGEFASGISYASLAKEKTNIESSVQSTQADNQKPVNTHPVKSQQNQTQSNSTQASSQKTGHWVESNKTASNVPQNVNVNIDLSKLGFNVNDLPFKLTPQEMEMLAASVASIQEAREKDANIASMNINITNSQEGGNAAAAGEDVPQEEEKITLAQIMAKGKEEELNYQYTRMIETYQSALQYSDDEDYFNNLPIIYTKLGLAYQKMSNWENALKYYEMAREFYEQTLEKVKENYIKLSIANIYYETYKPDLAKNYLMDIINSDDMPEILITKTYITFANIEDSLSNINSSYEYYRKAIKISNETMDTETLSELYFKYALIADDKGDIEEALEYYNKCIKLSSDDNLNKYLSAAYSNIATLHLEKNDKAYAAQCFLKAYELDKKNNNYDGMYFSATKLAQMAQKAYPDKAIEYLNQAKDCAIKLNDTFYVASATLATGDFYYAQKQNEKALVEYLNAYEIAKNDFSKDNLNKIQMRIDDIKFRIGLEAFNRIETEFKNAQRQEI